MGEKEIIKSISAYDAREMGVLTFIIFLTADLIMLIVYSLVKCSKGIYQRYNQVTGTWSTYYREWTPLSIADAFKTLAVPVIIIIVVGILLAFVISKFESELTITDKRVYGAGIFGKIVDFPLDSVSGIGLLSFFKGVTVKTSFGNIKFIGMKNYKDIYEVMGKLLAERQASKRIIR